MGNAFMSPCFQHGSKSSSVKVIFYQGITRILAGKRIAGEIMFEFPDHMVCHADSFFIGRPIPALGIDDDLISGHTYFVLPIERFSCVVLSSSLLSSFNSNSKLTPLNFGVCPFEYIKAANGNVLIKVVPEFIIRLMTKSHGVDGSSPRVDENEVLSDGSSPLCSTAELKKHYDMLVGSREQLWSPKLDTISEYKMRYSPCRFIGLEWKQNEEGLRA